MSIDTPLLEQDQEQEQQRKFPTAEEFLTAEERRRLYLRSLPSFTVDEWCAHRRIKKAHYYKLRKEGRGPRVYRDGVRPKITREADDDYIHAREAEAAQREVQS
jgi:hypothetical protein